MNDDDTVAPAWTRAKRDLVPNLAWAGAIMLVALVGSAIRRMGYLDSETLTRTVIGANGLMIAWMGNRMPKAFVAGACARRVRRVGGWAMALSGVVYAGMFAFAPLSLAYPVGAGAVFLGVAVTVGYCLLQRSKPTA
jgi:hypothetical protein